MSQICPFARKVNGNKYYCEILGETLPNIMGLHTTRYESCEVYQEGMERIETLRACLLKALKLGEEYVEKILSRLNGDYIVPTPEDCKKCDKINKKCICNINGFCVLKLQKVFDNETSPIEVEPVTLSVSRRKRGSR